MAGFKSIIENLRRAAIARSGACLALRDRYRRDLSTIHSKKMNEISIGIEHDSHGTSQRKECLLSHHEPAAHHQPRGSQAEGAEEILHGQAVQAWACVRAA